MSGSATAHPPAPANVEASSPYLLEISHISKGFPGVVALDDVQLRVRPGSVLALGRGSRR